MAFDAFLPRNSESRCIAISLRMIRKQAPHIRWVVSFADATQCGDGTIYRASGFMLTGYTKNKSIIRLADGSIAAKMTFTHGKHILKTAGAARPPDGSTTLDGFQFRYVYLIDKTCKLTVPVLPFSTIDKLGAGMYRGQKKSILDRKKPVRA